MSDQMLCMNCGHVGDPAQHTPGSFAIEVVLWLCLLVPGLIYSLWRMSARRHACAKCGAQHLVPQDAPVARSFMAQHGLADPARPAGVAAGKPSPAAYGVGAVLGGAVGRLLRGKSKPPG